MPQNPPLRAPASTFKPTANTKDDISYVSYDYAEEEELQKVGEIDFLAPSAPSQPVATPSSPLTERWSSNQNARHLSAPSTGIPESPFQPLNRKIVLSREEIMRKLQKLNKIKENDREIEDMMIRDFVKDLVKDTPY